MPGPQASARGQHALEREQQRERERQNAIERLGQWRDRRIAGAGDDRGRGRPLRRRRRTRVKRAQALREFRIQQLRQRGRIQRAGERDAAAAATGGAARQFLARVVAPQRRALGLVVRLDHRDAAGFDPRVERGRARAAQPEEPVASARERRIGRRRVERVATRLARIPRRDRGAQVAQRGRALRRVTHGKADRRRRASLRGIARATGQHAPVDRSTERRALAVESGELLGHQHGQRGTGRQASVELAQQARDRRGSGRHLGEIRKTGREPMPLPAASGSAARAAAASTPGATAT
jgi:hypothetical protein